MSKHCLPLYLRRVPNSSPALSFWRQVHLYPSDSSMEKTLDIPPICTESQLVGTNKTPTAKEPGVTLCSRLSKQFEPPHHKTNQRTSGPVNAHLTPGPGIYFNVFIHVYSPRAGVGNPLGTNVGVNRMPLSFCPFVAG